MASGTISDVDFYPASPQALAHNSNNLDRACAESNDSFSQQGLQSGVGPLTNNSRAISTNGYEVSPTLPRSGSPDEFYAAFKESSHITNGPVRSETSNYPTPRQPLSLATRSASSTTAPKYPPITQSRTPSKPFQRSASASVVERVQPRVGRSAAVQERIRMFDQKSGQGSSVPPGTSSSGSPRIPDLTSPSSSTSSRSIRPGQATRAPSSSRVISPQVPRTQRPRFTVEDQHSNNTLASAARPSKPRSRSNAPAEPSWGGNMAGNRTNAVSRTPLFGEIVTNESGSQIPYGISEPRGRARTSNDPNMSNSRTKNLGSDGQGSSPESPTEDWYRGGAAGSRNSNSPDFPGKHARSMSDSYQPMQPQGLFGAIDSPSTQDRQESKPQMKSRLPVMSKASAASSMSSGSSTVRANSAMSRRAASDGKTYQSSGSRPYSPAGNAGYSGRGTRTQPRNLSRPPANIQAMITPLSPPLKSPPLRSSKIRLPVSSASTASSRNKITEKVGQARSRAPSRASNGDESRSGPPHYVSPPDFAARRARITGQLSKRAPEIKEKEQQARERAEMEEAASQMQENIHDEAPDCSQHITDAELEALANRQPTSKPEESPILPQTELVAFSSRSPALGMPGSFPISQRASAETPVSAVSTDSVETLFDNELQTEPPTQQDITRPSIGSVAPIDYQHDRTLEHKNEVINFHQLLADATTDLAGDADRSQQYTDDESPAFPFQQPRSYDMMRAQNGGAKLGADRGRSDPSVDMPRIRSPSPAEEPSSKIFSADSTGLEHVASVSDGSYSDGVASFEANDHVVSHSPRPSWQLHPTSPPRSSHSKLPRLQTSASHLRPLKYASQDNAISAVTDMDVDDECADSSPRSPRLSVEGIIKPRPPLQGQDGAYDRKSNASESAFREDNLPSWPEDRISDAQIHEVLHVPPPPPKAPTHDQGPAVPPKSDGYTPLLTPRPHGDRPGATRSYPSSSEYPSFRARSTEAPNPVSSRERTPHSSGPVSANPSVHSSDRTNLDFGHGNGSSPNVWDKDMSLQLRSYTAVDLNMGGESGNTGPFRPSTSTARSSAFISNGSENADTPVSSNDQLDPSAVPHADCTVSVAEFASILQRKNHLMELVDTEAAFNKDMNVLVEIYQGTAVAVPDLKPDDIRTIFRNANQIIEVSKNFLADLKETTLPVYVHRSAKSKARTGEGKQIGDKSAARLYPTLESSEIEETKRNDEKTSVGEVFLKHIPAMLKAYTRFINGSSAATMRIQELQAEHPSIKVWLEECNDAASDLSAAWDLGSMLVKPMQRITKYPMMINDLLKQSRKEDKTLERKAHPDRAALEEAYKQMDGIVKKINADTARVEIVLGALSDHRKKGDLPAPSAGGLFKKVFKPEKIDLSPLERANEDPRYLFCVDRYHSEFARIEIIIRDIQQYVQKVTTQTEDFLRLLSAIELVVRAAVSSYPELESKWASFNLEMRGIEKHGLQAHVKCVNERFLTPFKSLARAYAAVQPTIALRNKRRPKFYEYEKAIEKLKKNDKAGKAKVDEKLSKPAREYTALNETIALELPQLSQLNEKLKKICLGAYVSSQREWYSLWNDKLRMGLEYRELPRNLQEITDKYLRDSYGPVQHAESMKLVNGTLLANIRAGRNSESTARDDDSTTKTKSRTSTINDRGRGYSVNSDHPPSSFLSPALAPTNSEPSPSYSTANSSGWSLAQPNKRDTGNTSHGMDGVGSGSQEAARTSHSYHSVAETRRTSTDSRQPRPSGDSFSLGPPSHPPPNVPNMPNMPPIPAGPRTPITTPHRDSGGWADGLAIPPQEPAFSDVFKSALPWSNSEEDVRSAERSSQGQEHAEGLKTLYVVASLCAFHIDGTKTEANYPYLTYQEGEIFDVVAEKGELWLAKNQDDPSGELGWIWNQHFARISSD